MAIQPASYKDTSTNYILSPMELTDTSKNLFTAIIDNIQGNEDLIGNLATESEAKFNEVISTVNTLKQGTDVDLGALEDTMAKIIELETSNGNESFVSVFQKMYDELNRRAETDTFRAVVTNAVGGKFSVDLSGFEFTSVDEYQAIVRIPTQANRLITGTFEKVDKNGGIITLRNEEVFQDADIATSFYDPQGNTLDVIVLIVRTAVPISGKVTLVDGSEAVFGSVATVYPSNFTVLSHFFGTDNGTVKCRLTVADGEEYGADGFTGTAVVSNIVLLDNTTKADVSANCSFNGYDNDFTAVLGSKAVKSYSVTGINKLNGVTQETPTPAYNYDVTWTELPQPKLVYKTFSTLQNRIQVEVVVPIVSGIRANLMNGGTVLSTAVPYGSDVVASDTDGYAEEVNVWHRELNVADMSAPLAYNLSWADGVATGQVAANYGVNLNQETVTVTVDSPTDSAVDVTGTCAAIPNSFVNVSYNVNIDGEFADNGIVYATTDANGDFSASIPLYPDEANAEIFVTVDVLESNNDSGIMAHGTGTASINKA